MRKIDLARLESLRREYRWPTDGALSYTKQLTFARALMDESEGLLQRARVLEDIEEEIAAARCASANGFSEESNIADRALVTALLLAISKQ